MMRRTRKAWTWWKTSAIAGLAAMAAGGGVMLLGGTETLWLVGLNLLVVGTLATLVSAIGAWLAETETPAASAGDVALARLIFVVRRDRHDLYAQLQSTLARQENVQVVLDRRDRPRDAFDREVVRRGWSVARVSA